MHLWVNAMACMLTTDKNGRVKGFMQTVGLHGPSCCCARHPMHRGNLRNSDVHCWYIDKQELHLYVGSIVGEYSAAVCIKTQCLERLWRSSCLYEQLEKQEQQGPHEQHEEQERPQLHCC